MHASNTAAWRAKVREASDGIEAVKKELGTGRLHPETIIFAEGQGSALILPTYLPVSWSAKIAPKLCSISWRPFREPSDGLEPSTPSLPWQRVATYGNGFGLFLRLPRLLDLPTIATVCNHGAP